MRVAAVSRDALMDERSPGARAWAKLVKQPQKPERVARALPRQRLPRDMDPEPMPLVYMDMPALLDQPLDLQQIDADALIAFGQPAGEFTLPLLPPMPVRTPGPAYIPPPPLPGLIAAVVPEPRSWAMLIAGFGLLGWQSRWRKARAPGHAC